MGLSIQDPKQWSLRKRLYNVQSVRRHTQERIICDEHLKKFHIENIAARMPTKKGKKSEYCLSESMIFNTPSIMIVSGATMSGMTERVKKLLAHKENMMIPVPKKVLFCYKY